MSAPAAAAHVPAGGGGGAVVVECGGLFTNVASIDFDKVTSNSLWYDAENYAEIAIERCNLDGREKTEVAGEIRAHVIGEDAPGFTSPGPTIDIANSGDPQEDVYGWLMTDENNDGLI